MDHHVAQLTAQPIPLRIVEFDFAEECGLLFYLLAIPDDHNLQIGGIEIPLCRALHVLGLQRADPFAVSFEIILRQIIQIHRRELRQQTLLRRETHGENAA